MRKVTVALPAWISRDEAQAEVVRDLRARALLKVELYRSKMQPFEAKYGMTLARFRQHGGEGLAGKLRGVGRLPRVGGRTHSAPRLEEALQ